MQLIDRVRNFINRMPLDDILAIYPGFAEKVDVVEAQATDEKQENQAIMDKALSKVQAASRKLRAVKEFRRIAGG
jgi:hypothetical protein